MQNPLLEHQHLMSNLKTRHAELLQLIDGRRAHLLDVPVYGNVGDLLILKGTQHFLKANKVRLAQVSSIHNLPKKIRPGDVLLFQGGGNFGDLYPVHQLHREELIARYRGNRIIILPQSIYFESPSAFEKCVEAMRQHPDLHIMVRDEVSLTSALKMTPHSRLMPDMAHQLYLVNKSPEPNGRRLLFQRLDKEAFSGKVEVAWHSKTDWDLLIAREMKTIGFFRRQLERFSKVKMDWLVMRMWLIYKDVLISRAERFFLQHDLVVTDRLHGHILASLLNTRNHVLDNSYGKNSSYVNAWTSCSPLVDLMPKSVK